MNLPPDISNRKSSIPLFIVSLGLGCLIGILVIFSLPKMLDRVSFHVFENSRSLFNGIGFKNVSFLYEDSQLRFPLALTWKDLKIYGDYGDHESSPQSPIILSISELSISPQNMLLSKFELKAKNIHIQTQNDLSNQKTIYFSNADNLVVDFPFSLAHLNRSMDLLDQGLKQLKSGIPTEIPITLNASTILTFAEKPIKVHWQTISTSDQKYKLSIHPEDLQIIITSLGENINTETISEILQNPLLLISTLSNQETDNLSKRGDTQFHTIKFSKTQKNKVNTSRNPNLFGLRLP